MIVSHRTIRLVCHRPATYALSVLVSTLLLTSKTRLPSMPARSASARILRLERLVAHRLELVEERRDPDRRDEIGDDDERDGGSSRVQPPSPRALAQQEIGHPQEQPAGHAGDGQHGQRIGPPFHQRLIGETVVMLANELFVVGERQRDDGGDDCEQRKVDNDREEPVAPDQPGPRTQAGGRATEEDGGEQHDRQHLVEHPQSIAARVVAKRRWCRRRHSDRCRFADGCRRRSRGWRAGRLQYVERDRERERRKHPR